MAKNKLGDKFYSIIATGLGVGNIPFAPGTWGSALGVLIWVTVNYFYQSKILWLSLLILLTILGTLAADFYGKKTKKNDAKEIVIDEIVGQLLTFFIAGIFIDVVSNYVLIFLGFVFFRLLDITKPFVIGLVDENIKGGIGVMLDDLLAGFAAAVLLYGVYVVFYS